MAKKFKFTVKVYYEDTDSGGVVYYANYLKFLERARTEALFSIGFSNKKVQENYNSLIIYLRIPYDQIFGLKFLFWYSINSLVNRF